MSLQPSKKNVIFILKHTENAEISERIFNDLISNKPDNSDLLAVITDSYNYKFVEAVFGYLIRIPQLMTFLLI